MATIFTGQKIVGKDFHDPNRPYDKVACAECGKAVSIRVAYIDKYFQPGKELYVHYDCLSQQRKDEIATDR